MAVVAVVAKAAKSAVLPKRNTAGRLADRPSRLRTSYSAGLAHIVLDVGLYRATAGCCFQNWVAC